MSIYRDQYGFVDPRRADPFGVVGIGGPMSVERLLHAYRKGIFPWSGEPVRWYSPDPRAIFWRIHLPRKLGKMVRRGKFSVSFDQAFEDVMIGCREAHRDDGVWITDEFIAGYRRLHEAGHAHSVEVWQQPEHGVGEPELVGGLYGVQLRGLFAGESMFFRATNASKVAFAALIWQLGLVGTVLLDCQVPTEHTARLGAVLVHRRDYLQLLDRAIQVPTLYDGERWPLAGAPGLAQVAEKYSLPILER